MPKCFSNLVKLQNDLNMKPLFLNFCELLMSFFKRRIKSIETVLLSFLTGENQKTRMFCFQSHVTVRRLWALRSSIPAHTWEHLGREGGWTELLSAVRWVSHGSGCRGSTWLHTAAGDPDSSGPSWAAAGPRDRFGPDRDNTGVCPPCHHRRAPGAPSCPSCPTGICTGSRSRIRISSGDPPPLTDSAGRNRSTGSGTASSAAGRSTGSWEGNSTCPVRDNQYTVG